MEQFTWELMVSTQGRGLIEITPEVERKVSAYEVTQGLLTIFIRHTSASLTIQENADPDVLRDLDAFFSRLVPDGDALFIHTSEGPDDMPSHIRSALTQTSLQVPVMGGRLALGTWQGIYLFEHRSRPHSRKIICHLIG
ncbi:MAG: YjbQ family protein [Alphaproteobacteria bacterium]|nr:YjbQ family protein [Alphaproteobacteria bacterium]MBT4020014.1 YjbQ family protein [Alphaproteobacteria bacterium]MBT5161296.1 YjbQ family protein [Alphaproteobacteria bacterium]MBT5917353.1 YjbQ family protein [Alphaproteobacteria bacterium]MBT6387558.1 YjbQ family protein [Alphaproteobacteria bacterium]